MVLSDRTIRRLLEEGRIRIDPYEPSLMQPSSLDVRVDRYFRVFRNSRYPFIDVKAQQEDLTELVEVADEEAFILHPGEFVLGSTLERVTLPDDLVARLEGKALALDTEIPTPGGWRLIEELRPGDCVFDERGRATLVVTPTIDLMSQWYGVLGAGFDVEVGLVGGGYHEIQPVTVTTYDSAYLHMERHGNRFGLVVFDECHHLPGPSFAIAAECCLAPYRLGLTATPERARP